MRFPPRPRRRSSTTCWISNAPRGRTWTSTALFDDAILGRLTMLGIEKGKPLAPDDRMKDIFDQEAKQGVAMSRAIVYASRDPEIRY